MTGHTVDVAIVGAGPYGLSLAAHLQAAGVTRRIFGVPMGFWRDHMPTGMLLKSEPAASNLSDPYHADTVAAYCRATTQAYEDRGVPISLATFLDYCQWFQLSQAPDVEPVLVTEVRRDSGGFHVYLADGARTRARAVVVATGLQHFAYVPRVLAGLYPDAVSHSSAHSDLSVFRGRRVAIVGAGQSALESAALLSEGGAAVQVVARRPHLQWNGEPLPVDRPLARRLREPLAALGSGWTAWFYSNHPALFRHLPAHQRTWRALTALGPAGAWWLRARIEGRVQVNLGHTLVGAENNDGTVRLRARTVHGDVADLVTEHVIAATGYRPDITRLPFLTPAITACVRSRGGAPEVGADFESSVPGLFFIGPVVASTFGPAMRFIWGAGFAARTITRRLAGAAETRYWRSRGGRTSISHRTRSRS